MTYRKAAKSKSSILPQAARVSQCLKGVSHEIRLAILVTLRSGEQSVNALVEAIGCPQPTLSQHLRTMLDRGILTSRRQGNQVFYQVRNPRIFDFLSLVKEVFCE